MRGRVIKAHVPSWIAEDPCYKGGMLDLSIRDHYSLTEAKRAIRHTLCVYAPGPPFVLPGITQGELSMVALLERWLMEGVIAEDSFEEHGRETLKEVSGALASMDHSPGDFEDLPPSGGPTNGDW